MEEVSNRFPSLVPMILENVNNESLVKFKETSREMSVFIVNERFYWIRILKKYNRNFQEFSKVWKMVIEKTPVDIIKKLVLAVEKFMIKRTWSDFFWQRSERQWSPLHIAAECRDLILLKHVISRTEDENHQHSKNSGNDLSALHLAAQEGYLEACQFIINRSLYKGEKDRYRRTPIDYGAIFGNLEVCRFLLHNLDDFPMGDLKIPLQVAPHYGHTEIFKLFFEHGKNKNLPLNPPNSSDDETPLHTAAGNGNFEICKLLIGNVENKSPRSSIGYTPLHESADNGNVEIFKLIFDNVQEKEPEDNKGQTPLHHAAECGNLEVCQLLIGESVSKDPMDNEGCRPLHLAAKHGHLEVCKLLLGESENKNPRDNNGWTPMHWAAQNGYKEICNLIASKVQVKNPKADDGATPKRLLKFFDQFSQDFVSISPQKRQRE